MRQQLSFIIMTTPHPSYMYFDAPSLTLPATAYVDLVLRPPLEAAAPITAGSPLAGKLIEAFQGHQRRLAFRYRGVERKQLVALDDHEHASNTQEVHLHSVGGAAEGGLRLRRRLFRGPYLLEMSACRQSLFNIPRQ